MIRLSSSLTLGLALFFPVFWYVFFGSLTLFIIATDSEDLPLSNPGAFKTGMLTTYLVFAFLIYKAFMKLRRVEIENEQLFVTNYFKTITFSTEHISKIHDQSIFGFIIVTLELDYKSFFGRKIRFITDTQKYQLLIQRMDRLKAKS